MTGIWDSITVWWLHALIVGSALLLLGYILVRVVRPPILKQRISAWTPRAALLGALLCAAPSWWFLPLSPPEPLVRPDLMPSATANMEYSVDPALGNDTTVEEEVGNEWPTPSARCLAPLPETPIPENATMVWHLQPPIREPADVPAPIEMKTISAINPPPPPESVDQNESDWLASLLKGAMLAYGFLVVLGLIRVACGQWALSRLHRRAQSPSGEVAELFQKSARHHRLTPIPKLQVSREIATPICYGLFRPCVMLPQSLSKRAHREQLQWVFAHEFTHLRQGDLWTGFWMAFVQAIYFFLPWTWWLRREQRLSQEYLADAAAVQGVSRAEEYADFLVRLSCQFRAGRRQRALLGTAGVKAGSSDLYRRVSMLLNGAEKMTTKCPRRWSVLTAGGFMALAVLFAGVGFQAQADDDKPEVKEEKKVRVIITQPKQFQVRPQVIRWIAVAEDDEQAEKKKIEVEKILEKIEEAELPEEAKKAIREAMKKVKAAEGKIGVFLQPNVADDFDKDLREQMKEIEKKLAELRARMGARQFAPIPQPVPNVPQIAPFANPNQDFRLFVAPSMQGGRLGVTISSPNEVLIEQLDLPEGQGIVINKVSEDSAAAKAGIKPNDILLELAGEKVPSDIAKFVRSVQAIEADKKIDAVVLRKGRKETIKDIELPEASKVKEGNRLFQFTPIAPVPPVGPKPPIRFQVKPEGRLKNREVPKGEQGGTRSEESVSVRVENGNVRADYRSGDIHLEIEGVVENGKLKITEVEVDDGDQEITETNPDKLPAKYKKVLERLLKNIHVN